MTEDTKEIPLIYKLCEAARIESGALGAALILFHDAGSVADVTFAWDGSNACHAIAPQALRSVADSVEHQGKQEPPQAH